MDGTAVDRFLSYYKTATQHALQQLHILGLHDSATPREARRFIEQYIYEPFNITSKRRARITRYLYGDDENTGEAQSDKELLQIPDCHKPLKKRRLKEDF